MHKYNKATTKYKDIPMEDKIFSYLDKQNTNGADKLSMLLAHLSSPQFCYSWVSEDDFNNLLEEYKIDITPYVKDDERITTSIKSNIADRMFHLVNTDKYKKRNLIKVLRELFPDVNAGVIHRLIKKNLSLRILEIDRTYKTKPYVIKGKYYIGGYMKRYKVTVPEQELIVEAEDEGDAESQALGLWDWGNVDMEVEEDE